MLAVQKPVDALMAQDEGLRTRSKSPSQARYSHLLYLSDAERVHYTAQIQRSASSSCRSVRSSQSIKSSAKSHLSASTNISSIKSCPPTTRFADDHYPLISTIELEHVPSSVPKDHAALWCARQMAQIHNAITRALNSSWNHATSVKPSEAGDFLRFNQILFETLDQHHKVEDEYMFPALERILNRPGAMEETIKGPEAVAEGLAIFQKYVFITKPDEFNGTTFRHIIESFAPALIQHLHDEIPTLVRLHVLDSNQLMKIWKHAQHLSTKNTCLYTHVPWLLGCHDKSFKIDGVKSSFPDAPWILEAIVRNWHARKHASVWKFCPSNLRGQRRQILAA